MKRGFTLIELLVVIGIMGLLGTVSVGGYQQMRRGMEEKGVIQDVNTLIRAAYQRAQIDRQPTAVVFWNETLRGENDVEGENMIVVGHAVAVRRAGRITEVSSDILFDEFGDLELSYQTDDGDDGSSNTRSDMYLYPMDNLSDVEQSTAIRRSLVETKVYGDKRTPVYLTGTGLKTENVLSPSGSSASSNYNPGQGDIYVYGFKVKDQNGVTWKNGMAYGMEFAHVVLPHGYFFGQGSSYSTSSDDPIREAGTLVFDVGKNIGKGMTSGSQGGLGTRASVSISAFRLGSSGTLEPKRIGETAKPTDQLR